MLSNRGKNILCLIAATLYLGCAQLVLAQEYSDDAAVWLSVLVVKKMNRHLDIRLSHQSRMNENVQRYARGDAEVGFTWHLNKHIKFLADYTFIERRNLDDSYSTRHRGSAALVLRTSWRKWGFIYRNMLQVRVKDIYTSEDGAVPVYFERNKAIIRFDINKYLTAYTAGELYYPLDQSKHKGFSRSRTYAGVIYRLSRTTDIEPYFLYQHELNAFGPTNRDFVYGVAVTYEF